MSDPEVDQNKIALSVIIPCFNHGNFLLEAVASVESCQEPVYEIIIVNDGSTDALTERVLGYLQEKGYQVINQENQGLALARNNGIERARGLYVLPLDADNKIRPNYITQGIKILDENPEVGVAYGNYEFFGDKTGIWKLPEFDINRIVRGNYIDACAVIRKKVWQDCGGYDDKIPDKLGYEDWDFWLGAAERGWQFYHIDEVLFDYRYRDDSMVSGCNIPENHRELFRYISSKHSGLYTANFANIFAEVECDFVKERDKVKILEERLEEIELELDLERSQHYETEARCQEIEGQLQESETRLKETQSDREQLQEQLEETRAKLEKSQARVEKTETELHGAEAELSSARAELEQAEEAKKEELAELTRSGTELQLQLQTRVGQAEAEWQAKQAEVAELERSKTELQAQLGQAREQLTELMQTSEQLQTQLRQTNEQLQTQLRQTSEQLQTQIQQQQEQLVHTSVELQSAREAIAAMKTSKFWKLRTQWFKLKKASGLPGEEET